jgi:hypothetical protein
MKAGKILLSKTKELVRKNYYYIILQYLNFIKNTIIKNLLKQLHHTFL